MRWVRRIFGREFIWFNSGSTWPLKGKNDGVSTRRKFPSDVPKKLGSSFYSTAKLFTKLFTVRQRADASRFQLLIYAKST